MRYAHTNLIAKDWQRLSRFYQIVFGCKPAGPQRDLSGEWLERLTGIPAVHIVGEHLTLPGHDGNAPTLEIFSYAAMQQTDLPINTCGFSHIAFEVSDVRETVEIVIREGGSLLGEIVSKDYFDPQKYPDPEAGGSLLGEIVSKDYGALGEGTFAYARDPEGNFIELQSWRPAPV